MTTASVRARTASLYPLLADRHSPRSFDTGHEITDDEVAALLEAARWAPSSMNRQPWRLAVARRGTAAHASVLQTLAEGNRRWAGDASALVVAVAERVRDGRAISTADYDLGLAMGQLTVQAHALGLHVHQMGGFDHAALADHLGLRAGLAPLVVIAVGRRADAGRLPDDLRAREVAPRVRRPLHETVLHLDGQRWPSGDEARQEPAA